MGVLFGVGGRQPLRFGGPERQRLVAAGGRLEAQVFVVSELLFERVLAILECVGHGGLRHSKRSRILAKPRGGDCALLGPSRPDDEGAYGGFRWPAQCGLSPNERAPPVTLR